MRHGKKILKIGRTASHRKATLQSMSAALIEHKRIRTTLGKARALRKFVEPIISKSKDPSTHSRRQAFRRLQDKETVKRLYGEIADAVGDRPGGYTRVVKLGQRGGDAAEMAIVELVDFNDVKPEGSSTKKKTRRSRRSSGGSKSAAPKAAAITEASVTQNAVVEVPSEDEATEAPETQPEDAVEAADDDATQGEPADAVGTDSATPDTVGTAQVPPSADEHPDAEQGAPAGTGEPGPGADAENQGRSGEAR